MPRLPGIDNLRRFDLSILYLIYLKLRCPSEMLKYLSILISYCYFNFDSAPCITISYLSAPDQPSTIPSPACCSVFSAVVIVSAAPFQMPDLAIWHLDYISGKYLDHISFNILDYSLFPILIICSLTFFIPSVKEQLLSVP